MEEEIQEKDVKVIILGETGVGKTSIINRFINDEFNPDNDIETLGSAIKNHEIQSLALATYELLEIFFKAEIID